MPRRLPLTFVILVASLSCDPRPPGSFCERRIAFTVDRLVFTPPTPTDILLVLDNSPSMIDEQTRVCDSTLEMVEPWTWSPRPWRLGSITMDLGSVEDGGRLRRWPGGTLWAEWPPPPSADVAGARETLLTELGTLLTQMGTSGSRREAGLEAIRRAVDPNGPPEVATHNSGFLRAGADLALLIVADEDDCSAADYDDDSGADAWCITDADLNPVADYVESVIAAKPDGGATAVRAAVLVGGSYDAEGELAPTGCTAGADGPDAACGCWSNSTAGDVSACSLLADIGHSCTASCDPECEALPANRYLTFIDDLGSRRAALGFPRGTPAQSICDPLGWSVPPVYRIPWWSCMKLPQPVTDEHQVFVEVRARDPWTGEETTRSLPSSSHADCDAFPDGAWELSDEVICLTCGLSFEDLVEISVRVLEVELAEGCPGSSGI